MKKGAIGIFILFFINFASAQEFSNLLESIDQSIVILFTTFIVAFSILFFSLLRVFKDNKMIAGSIAAALSFLIVYGINKSGFDVGGFFSGIGISEKTIWTIVPLLIIAGIIFIVIQLKKDSLLAVGGLLILLSFFVYTKTFFIVAGVILILIRFFIPKGKWENKERKRRKR